MSVNANHPNRGTTLYIKYYYIYVQYVYRRENVIKLVRERVILKNKSKTNC